MAKGDHESVSTAVGDAAASNKAGNAPMSKNFNAQNTSAQGNYNQAVGTNMNDYNSIMNQYRGISQNGGFDAQGIQDMRSRAVSPIRSMYQNAQAGLDRNRALQGGYSPNYAAASTKMARDMSGQMSDANTNANAALAQMQQQGRLYGMAGQQGMYGATPGMSNMFGNQLASSNQNMLGAQGLLQQANQNDVQGRLGEAQVPGDFQQAMGNIGSGLGVVGNVVGAMNPLKGIFG